MTRLFIGTAGTLACFTCTDSYEVLPCMYRLFNFLIWNGLKCSWVINFCSSTSQSVILSLSLCLFLWGMSRSDPFMRCLTPRTVCSELLTARPGFQWVFIWWAFVQWVFVLHSQTVGCSMQFSTFVSVTDCMLRNVWCRCRSFNIPDLSCLEKSSRFFYTSDITIPVALMNSNWEKGGKFCCAMEDEE